MRITNGKIVILIGIIHTVFTLLPSVYGKQFLNFGQQFFFYIHPGFLEMGRLNYETFAAFWCFFFGLLLFPLGALLDYVEKSGLKISRQFIWIYLIVILIGVYMIPFSGFTVFLLPHAVYMVVKGRRGKGVTVGG